MRIGRKILVSFLFITLLVSIGGYIGIVKLQQELATKISAESSRLASTLIDNIDKSIYNRIEQLKIYADVQALAVQAQHSNKVFQEIQSRESYINTLDKDWKEGRDTSAIRKILSNQLSTDITAFVAAMNKGYDYQLISEAYVTNQYGVVIGASGRTSDYLQADEDWYKQAIEEQDFWVGDLEYDKSSKVYASDIVINLYDNSGQYIGIFKAVLNIAEPIRIIRESEQRDTHNSRQTKLLTRTGQMIYSTDHDTPLQFAPPSILLFLNTKLPNSGAIAAPGDMPGEEEEIFASSLSGGYRDYRGLGWTLIVEHDSEEILTSVSVLKKEVLGFLIIVLAIGIFLSAFIARSISKPLVMLSNAASRLGKGQWNTHVEAKSKDEVGTLSKAFNQMVDELRGTTVSRNYVDQILKTMPGALIIMNPDAVIESVNQAALDLLGYEEKELIGQSIYFILAEEEATLLEKSSTGLLSRNGYVSNVDKFYFTKDSRKIPVLFSGTMMSDVEGKNRSIVSVAIDISQRKEHEEKLRRTSRALGAIHASNILLVRSDDEQRLLEGVCHNIVEQTGYRFAWVGLLRPDDAGVILPAAWAGEEQGYIDSLQRCLRVDELTSCPEASAIRTGAACIEMDISNAPGRFHWRKQATERGYKSVIVFPLMREKEAFGMLAIYSTQSNSFKPDEVELLQELADDLAYGVTALRTRQKHQQAEQLIAYQASHDALTDLPNRSTIMQSLNQTINQLRHQGGAVAVLFIDLDEFKLVNDTLGHAAGDELLRQAAGRMKSATRDADIIARQGGDEFIVLLAKYGEQIVKTDFEQLAATVAQRILDGLQKPFRVQGQDAYVSASIGISLLPGDTDDAAQLIQYADHAMYRAKELGRNNYQYFCKELSERQQKKMSLATMLHKAIEQQEFRLHYQPLIDLNNGRMVGVEALIRWEQEEGRLVSPADFLPVAEDTGLILPIGDWVAQEACRQIREWADKGISLPVAINLSARQMWHGDIAHQILNIINETGVSKNMLEIEVTESSMIIDPERMAKTLEHFNEKGIKISLDDFGTGYSSLDRLKHLPFNKLKIDKSFVDGIPDDEDDIAIVTATVQMARNLKLYSLAEGIETVEQYRFLKNLGCNYGQGYYFSRPVPATEIECMFKQNRHWELNTREFNDFSPELIEG